MGEGLRGGKARQACSWQPAACCDQGRAWAAGCGAEASGSEAAAWEAGKAAGWAAAALGAGKAGGWAAHVAAACAA